MENPNEEYTLVLNEHANNFSISLSNLLQRNELVDVTLAGDGGIFNAHRLVLSVVSPYFQRMFTQLPTNQQAIVFMKDVSRECLAELITFIYTGEVNVKECNLKDFLSIANALEIKGLAYENSTQPADPLANTNGLQYQSMQTLRVQNTSANATIIPEMPTVTQYPKQSVDIEMNGNPFGMANTNHSDDFQEILSLIDTNIDIPWDFDDRKENGCKSVNANASSTKRTKANEGYNIVADVRQGHSGRKNLFHNGYKFAKHGRGLTKQRWVCCKNSCERCKSSMSTMEVDGVTMMKVLIAEHTHEPHQFNK